MIYCCFCSSYVGDVNDVNFCEKHIDFKLTTTNIFTKNTYDLYEQFS